MNSLRPETYEISINRLGLALRALMCLGSVPLFVHLWHLAGQPLDHRVFVLRQVAPPFFVYSLCVLGIPTMLAVALCFSIKMFDRKPGLTLDDQAIIDNGIGGAGRVPWEQVKLVRITAASKQKTLVSTAIVVIDVEMPDDFDRGKAFCRRKIGALNRAMYGSPVVLSPPFLGMEAFELVAVINSYRPKHELAVA